MVRVTGYGFLIMLLAYRIPITLFFRKRQYLDNPDYLLAFQKLETV